MQTGAARCRTATNLGHLASDRAAPAQQSRYVFGLVGRTAAVDSLATALPRTDESGVDPLTPITGSALGVCNRNDRQLLAGDEVDNAVREAADSLGPHDWFPLPTRPDAP